MLGLVLGVATVLWWHGSHGRRAGERAVTETGFELRVTNAFLSAAPAQVQKGPFALVATNAPNAAMTNPFAYRLSNTSEPFQKLLRNERAVLLRNALIDTARGEGLKIPGHLRAQGDPGSYIVQARGAITPAFRARLVAAGAEIISYVPNNAYLVRASAGVARSLSDFAVLPFEPYYKLDARLLPLAVEQQLSPYQLLNIVSFPGATARAQAELEKAGVTVIGKPQSTPYGDVLVGKVPADRVSQVAGIAEVQLVGVHFEKHTANDLTRVLVRISTNTIVPPPQSHYAAPTPADNLTGNGVLVAMADTGVDETHPDFAGRFTSANPIDLIDFDGHGTHVAGILSGNGSQSLSVGSPDGTNSYARGSTNGAYFTGMAPEVHVFVQNLNGPDDLLQRNTALQGALISNNSWGYSGDNDYDIFAASYDGAVRDSLPGVLGEQEVLYVFAAGNDGGGGDQGLNGIAGSVISPATAKNVISVGATDLPRFLTNEVHRACRDETNTIGTNTVVITVCQTNRPWYGMTDTNNQVSPYSSRGNVGIGIEGPFGRFKPDVVAPGSMLVSTRSKDYQEPEGSTNTSVFQYNALNIGYLETNLFALIIPPNAVALSILTLPNLQSPTNLTLWIGADIDQVPGAGSAYNTNRLDLDRASAPVALRRGTLYYTIANTNHDPSASFDLVLLLTVTNDVGDYYTVLKQLNAPLKPWYRYEAGTSMAAPAVSGMLADIQQYLTNQFSLRPSPALLKALLINGARSLSANYNLQINAPINHQGWGLVNMSNSIPTGLSPSATNGPMRFFDQSLTNSLATGGTEVYEVSVPDEAKSYPLRITLVWTDPPGNPVTTVKLVNDLNLYVTGESTNSTSDTNGLVWLGNSFPPGSDFTEPIVAVSNGVPVLSVAQQIDDARDFVNNVENVYIRPPLASSYTVVVKGHRVNVNAVNSHSNSLAQDYALVISSGNVSPSNNVNLAVTGPVFTNDFAPRIAALARASNATSAGLLNQRVGANNPLITSTNGASNQWAFFTYTNVTTANFTNVAVITFFPVELSRPRFREADIDLYVSRNKDLFLLDDAVIGGSTRSTTRGGTELVLFTDAQPDEVFYIGVKSEDQQAANFSIFAASSDKPFSSRDSSNNIVAQVIPLPTPIPDGTPDAPGGTNLFALVFEPDVTVQRVYVTNRIYHEEAGDLIGIISHTDSSPDGTDASVTLNNHRTWTGYENPAAPYNIIYDDSDEGDLGDETTIPPVFLPDGPGRLRDFVGQKAFGIWNYTISDNAMFHTGAVEELTLVIQPASTNNDDAVNLTATILPMRWLYAGFRVPADATNVQVCLTTDGPAEVYLRRGDFPTLTLFDKKSNMVPPGACMNYDFNDSPPLSAGRYFVGVYNPGANAIHVHLVVTVQRGLLSDRTTTAANDNLTSLTDDATTNSTIFVTNRGIITSVEVDVRLNHPRVSDLALHLTSPGGTRLLLAENRGHDSTNGYGVSVSNFVVTNFMARVMDTSWEEQNGFGFGVGTILSGWRVNSGDVDVSFANDTASGGFYFGSHTGTNALDLDGNTAGAVSTNVTTVAGKTYLLSFAFTKNRNVPPPKSCRLEINGVPLTDITYAAVNGPTNLNWVETNFVIRAASNLTGIAFISTSPGNGGIFLDTIHLDEVEITTNSLLYATFTDDTLKALLPIKFAPPPFGDTNFVSTNKFISGFEGTNGTVFTNKLIYTNANLFTNGESYDGWLVTSNNVYVQTNDAFAYSGTNFLLLRTGTVSRVLSNTIRGKEYVLEFATRVAPRRLIYSTGVDEDALALPYGTLDSHYYTSSNSVTRATNAAYVLRITAPPMGGSWINTNLSDCHWIGVNATSPPPGNARYGFKTKFDLTGYKWTNATLTGGFQSDGAAVSVLLNGTNFPGPLTVPGQTSYRTGFIPLTFTNGFLPGINSLEVILTNAATPLNNTACGLQIQFAADAIKAPLLFSNRPPRLSTAVGQVRLAGCYTNYFTALSDEWRIQRVTFVAISNNVLLQFTGVTPGVWLDHVQIHETGRKYYLPEEPLTPLTGQQAFGPWKLEVWDSRLGATLSDSDLLSWRLNLNYVRTNPPFFRLQNGVPTPRLTIATNALRYFTFDVPCDAGTVSNYLQSLTLPNALDVWFNQDTFPLTGGFGDFLLMLNETNHTEYLTVSVAPLLRSGRYFMAVKNTNAVPVDFVLTAGMFNSPCPQPPAPLIGITKSSFGPSGFALEWSADASDEYSIQYADDPAGPWIELPQTITSPTGDFSFLDDGSSTGGLPPQRFYRLRRH